MVIQQQGTQEILDQISVIKQDFISKKIQSIAIDRLFQLESALLTPSALWHEVDFFSLFNPLVHLGVNNS